MKHRPFGAVLLTLKREHQQVGSLGGAPRPREFNKGPQRPAQMGQKPIVECKGKSWFDTDRANNDP